MIDEQSNCRYFYKALTTANKMYGIQYCSIIYTLILYKTHAEKGLIHFLYSLKMEKTEANIISLEGGTRINVVPDLTTAIVAEVTEEDVVAQIRSLGLGKHFKVETDLKGVKITSMGITGHASLPEKGWNAIQNMLQLLAALFSKANTPLSKFINYLAKHLKMETNGASLGIYCHGEL